MKAERALPALALVVSLAVAASGQEEVAPCGSVGLQEVAAVTGIEFRHERGAAGAKHLPETMGAGLAWLDADGDGWWDLYLVQSGAFPPDGTAAAADRLFRNLEGKGFAEAAQAGLRGYGQGVVAADVEGDGDTDLYLTHFGANALLRNRGDGTFDEVAAAAGLEVGGWSSSAAFADADGDGDLDLYVSRYLHYDPAHGLFCGDPESGDRRYCDPSLFLGAGDRFFRNRGDGTFADATAEAGVAPADGRGLGVIWSDLDDDGRPDLYVANDLTTNLLLHNLGDGTFEDVSLLSGTAVNREGKPEAGMGIAVGDVDGDLDPDLGVTNFDVETNTLYANLGGMAFEDVAAASGFGPPSFNFLAFGVAFLDLDRDGDLDAYIANGHIFEQPRRDTVSYRQRDQVLLGDGKGGFKELRCAALAARQTVARGLAVADYDNDGDPDLGIQANGGAFTLLRNEVSRGGWLGLDLRGAAPNTGAVGARAVLTTRRGRQVRWVLAGDSYQSSSDRRLLFGLDEGDEPVALEVRWPGGRILRLEAPPRDRYLVLFEQR